MQTCARSLSAIAIAGLLSVVRVIAQAPPLMILERCPPVTDTERRFSATVVAAVSAPVFCLSAGDTTLPTVIDTACRAANSNAVIFTDDESSSLLRAKCPSLRRVDGQTTTAPLIFIKRQCAGPENCAASEKGTVGFVQAPKPTNLLRRVAAELYPTWTIDDRFDKPVDLALALFKKTIDVAIVVDEGAHGSIKDFAAHAKTLGATFDIYLPEKKALAEQDKSIDTISISTIPDLTTSLTQLAIPPPKTYALALSGGTISSEVPTSAKNASEASWMASAFATFFGWTAAAENVALSSVAHVPAAFATAGAGPANENDAKLLLSRAYVTALPRLKTNPCDDDTLFTVRAFLSAAFRANESNGVVQAALREQYELDPEHHHQGWSLAEAAQLASFETVQDFLSKLVPIPAQCPRAGNRPHFAHQNDPKQDLRDALIYQRAALQLIEEAQQGKGAVDQAKLRAAAGCVLEALNLHHDPACSVPGPGMWTDAYLPALRGSVIQAHEKR
jgi:hypothetical protein